MSLFALLIATHLGAQPADIGVIMSRRDGVTKKQAQDVLAACVSTLQSNGLSVANEPLDGSKCSGKKACLVAMGRKAEHQQLVIVEVASVLDEGLVRAEVVSVDEDGKQLAQTEYQGALTQKQAIVTSLMKLVAPLKAALTPAPVAVTPPTPVVEPVKPAAVTQPAPVATAAPAPAISTQPVEKPGVSTRSIIGISLIGAGAAAGIVSGVFGAQALADKAKVDMLCPERNKCADETAYAAYKSAAQSQNIGIGLAVGAGVLAVTGAVLWLTGGPSKADESPTVSFMVTPSSAAASLSLVW